MTNCCGYGKLVTVNPVTFHEYEPNATIPKVIESHVLGWLKLCTFCIRTTFVWKGRVS